MGGREDEVVQGLRRLLADASADAAAVDRAKTRVLREIAETDATFAGLAVELAERGDPVVASTGTGRTHRGRIAGVGTDFLTMGGAEGPAVFLPLARITSLRVHHGDTAPDTTGDRTAPFELELIDVLSRLSEDRPRVVILSVGDEHPVTGVLRAVGRDLLTVRLDGEQRRTAYVPIGSVAELLLLD